MSSFKDRIKEINESFKQNATSVQQMIADMETEIFQLLKKKEKLREKVVALREEKRLQPTMRDRTAILLDDVADFANLYNLRQPAESKIPGVAVSSSSDRPVLGEGPKLTRHLVLEMNPAEVALEQQTPPQTPLSPKGSSIINNNSNSATSPSSPRDMTNNADTSSQVSGSAFSLGSAGGHNVQMVDQPSVACAFGFAFRSLNFPFVPPGSRVVVNNNNNNNNHNRNHNNSNIGLSSSTSTTATSAANAPSSPSPLLIDPTEAPIVGLRFNLVLPAQNSSNSSNNTHDLEIVRDKIQQKIDSQVEELRSSIDSAKKTFDDAFEKAEREHEKEEKKEVRDEDEKPQDPQQPQQEQDVEKKKEQKNESVGEKKPNGNDNDNDSAGDLNLDAVGDLLWKSLRLVVGVTRGVSAHPSRFSVAVVTIYVYRILTDEQKAKQAKLTASMEQKINSAIKEAGADGDLNEAKDFASSRTARQLSAVCRLIADCNFSVTCEVQITAQQQQQQQQQVPLQKSNSQLGLVTSPTRPAGTRGGFDSIQKPSSPSSSPTSTTPAAIVASTTTVANNNDNNDDQSPAPPSTTLLSMERKATDVVSRILESAPRIERAIQESLKAFTKKDALLSSAASASSTDDELREMKKKSVEQAQMLYKESILPAIQRNIDPDDKVIALINQLVGGTQPYFSPANIVNMTSVSKQGGSPAVAGRTGATPNSSTTTSTSTSAITSTSSSSISSPNTGASPRTVAASAGNKISEHQKQKTANEDDAAALATPFAITLNVHHCELHNIPKQLVRQTANMIYDYFLDTTASLSGRAYIGMCRRRTLAGVALYDALHFNVVPLAQGGKSDTAKSACAFYHAEKLLRGAIVSLVEQAVEQAVQAKVKVTRAIGDESIAADGKKLNETVGRAQSAAAKLLPSLAGASKDSLLASTLSTLKFAIKIGKNLFTKFKEDRDKTIRESSEAAEDVDAELPKTNAFAFVDGQVCCCDLGRPLEIDVFMPDSRAVATFKLVLRPSRPEMVSPRIRARRKDAKSASAQAATLAAQNCTGYCTAALPEFALQIGEAFANLWLAQIEDFVVKETQEKA